MGSILNQSGVFASKYFVSDAEYCAERHLVSDLYDHNKEIWLFGYPQ